MKAHRVIRIVSVSLAIAGLLFGTVSPAVATCLWRTGPLPKDATIPGVPTSIRAFASNDIWVASDDDRVLLHWNGAAWSVVNIPVNTPPTTVLDAAAVTGTSDNDLWIDAIFRSPSEQYSKSLHFDGSRWTVTRMPSGFAPSKICLGEGPLINAMQAFASNDVWATGVVCHLSNGRSITDAISEHWDGTRWNILRMADPTKFQPYGLPSQMSATSDRDIWVIGEDAGSDAIEHFDGSHWSISSKRGALNAKLEAVFAGAADDAWVVGFALLPQQAGHRTFAAHWDGVSWSRVATPNEDNLHAARFNDLHAVSGSARNDVWAVGEDDRVFGPPDGNARLQVMHWDGASWSNETSDKLGPGGYYSVIDLGVRDVWALGSDNPNVGSSNPVGAFRCAH